MQYLSSLISIILVLLCHTGYAQQHNSLLSNNYKLDKKSEYTTLQVRNNNAKKYQDISENASLLAVKKSDIFNNSEFNSKYANNLLSWQEQPFDLLVTINTFNDFYTKNVSKHKNKNLGHKFYLYWQNFQQNRQIFFLITTFYYALNEVLLINLCIAFIAAVLFLYSFYRSLCQREILKDLIERF